MLEKPFFKVRLNLFMNNFYKHFFGSSRLQMFFKISALKSFAILITKRHSNIGASSKKQPDVTY